MPKLRKEDVSDIDVDALESAEYSDEKFDSYNGDIPPNDTILRAYVKAMWWTRTQGGNAMLKVLVIAGDNEGDLEEYNGLPMWENMALTTSAKFKWAPFFEHFGFSIRDIKTKIVVAPEDDDKGAPIEKFSTFVPGSDDSWCRVLTSRERYDDKWQAHVASWLDYEDEDEEDAEEEEPEEDEEEAEEEEPEEDEEEEESAPPARGRRQAAKPAAKPAARTASKPSAEPAATPTRPAARRAATASSGPAKTRSARATPAAAKAAPARRGKGKASAGYDDEPPF